MTIDMFGDYLKVGFWARNPITNFIGVITRIDGDIITIEGRHYDGSPTGITEEHHRLNITRCNT